MALKLRCKNRIVYEPQISEYDSHVHNKHASVACILTETTPNIQLYYMLWRYCHLHRHHRLLSAADTMRRAIPRYFEYFIEKMQSTFLEDFLVIAFDSAGSGAAVVAACMCDLLLTLHSRGSLPFKLVCLFVRRLSFVCACIVRWMGDSPMSIDRMRSDI